MSPPAPPRSAVGTSTLSPRFDAPDLLRGIIMVVMLLDHTRDFTHAAALQFDPTNLEQTNVALFFTRWITHFCAPLFVFLAGMAVAFQQHRGKSDRELSAFLLKRGIWLCLLELIVIRFLVLWTFDVSFFFLQVIWVFGVSMICLAVLIRVPKVVALAIGLALVLGHNAFDAVLIAPWAGADNSIPSAAGKLWMVLHQQGAFPIAGWPSPVLFVLYPVLPWIGVMTLGWLLGDVYRWDAARRRAVLLKLGIALTAAFVLLRAANVYGDPSRWAGQESSMFSVLSFLNTTKYPPSLLFLLMTIGPGLIALSLFERDRIAPRSALASALITYGRVPLFFYILQWIYAKSAGFLLSEIFGRDNAHFTMSFLQWTWNDQIGFPLWVTHAVWITGAVLLYFPCRWFARLKARRRDWWLSYL